MRKVKININMKNADKTLKLKDFLETRDLESSKYCWLDMALENVMDGNIGASALGQLDNLYYEVFQLIPKCENERHLFRFSGISSDNSWNGLVSDIENNAITLSSPSRFNDPMDPLIRAWVRQRQIHYDDKVDKVMYQLVGKALEKTRICCMVDPLKNKRKLCSKKDIPRIEGCNPLMWAHYANSHKGICLQYKITPSNILDTNEMVVRLLDVNYDKTLPLDGDISFIDSLIIKGDCWRYEKESRLTMYSKRKTKEFCQLKGYEIEAVYMGCEIDPKKRGEIKNILRGSNVQLYQMAFSKQDITKLESHRIDL